GRGMAAGLVYLLLLALVLAILGIVIPLMIEQLDNLNLDVQEMLRGIETWLARDLVIAGYTVDLARLMGQAGQALDGYLQPLFGHTLIVAVDVVTSLLWVVFIFVVSFYLVRDRGSVTQGFDRLWPSAYQQDARRLRSQIDGVWRAFFRGQVTLALVVAGILTVIGALVGLPFPLAMGALAGLLEFLPSVGHGLWMVAAAMLMLFRGSTWLPVPGWVAAATIVAIHLVFQQVDMNILIPRLVGRRVRLHPIVVITGVLAGAIVAGVLGVVLAAPVIGSARVLGEYVRAHLEDRDPFESVSAAGPRDVDLSIGREA
ncbi:MAG TPA: AI-2E family transporter, partial [Desulfurivibrionaceae bacterium]|nr:AI-2E family transporter [Desulfurivibrionaceae bacterium]